MLLDSFSCQFFRSFEFEFYCFVLAICDIVHNVEAIHGPS